MKQVFLSYARADSKKAKRLYDELCRLRHIRVWFDRVDLLPGVKWEPAIRKAIRESDYFLAVLSSRSVSTRGVRHSELREALDVSKQFPSDWIYLVPTRLDDCPMPFPELTELNYVDLFPTWRDGVGQLRRTFGTQKHIKRLRSSTRLDDVQDDGISRVGADKPRTSKPDRQYHLEVKSQTATTDFHYKVGLANLDHPKLNNIVKRVTDGLNRVQSIFHLVQEPLNAPRQALVRIDRVQHLYIAKLTSRFYKRIGPLDMDCVVCLTQRMLAFEEGDSVLYNYLTGPSSIDPRLLFVSHANLDEHAQAAGVTLEVALAYRITGELASYFLDLGYHRETRNCPMDFTKLHSDLVGGIRAGRFCPHCSERFKDLISRPFAQAFQSMIAWGR